MGVGFKTLRSKSAVREFRNYMQFMPKKYKSLIHNTLLFDYFFYDEDLLEEKPLITNEYRSKFEFRTSDQSPDSMLLESNISSTQSIIKIKSEQQTGFQQGDLIMILSSSRSSSHSSIVSKREIVCIDKIYDDGIEIIRNAYSPSLEWEEGSIIQLLCHASVHPPSKELVLSEKRFNYTQIFQSSAVIPNDDVDTDKSSEELKAFVKLLTQIEKSIFFGQSAVFDDFLDYETLNTTTAGILEFVPPHNKISQQKHTFTTNTLFDFFEKILSSRKQNYDYTHEYDFYVGISLYSLITSVFENSRIPIIKNKFFYHQNEFLELEAIRFYKYTINLKPLILGNIYRNSGILMPKNSIELLSTQDKFIDKILEKSKDYTKLTLRAEVGVLPMHTSETGILDLIY